MINADALQDQSTFDTGRLCPVQAEKVNTGPHPVPVARDRDQ
jgi:hypothetical protein